MHDGAVQGVCVVSWIYRGARHPNGLVRSSEERCPRCDEFHEWEQDEDGHWDEYECEEEPDEDVPRVECAWCGRILSEGVLPVSHGICGPCAARIGLPQPEEVTT